MCFRAISNKFVMPKEFSYSSAAVVDTIGGESFFGFYEKSSLELVAGELLELYCGLLVQRGSKLHLVDSQVLAVHTFEAGISMWSPYSVKVSCTSWQVRCA